MYNSSWNHAVGAHEPFRTFSWMPDLVLGIREGFLEEVTSGLDLGEEELLAVERGKV